MSFCADTITIKEVMNCHSGLPIKTKDLIDSLAYDELIQFRSSLKRGIVNKAPLYVCSICGSHVYLNCRKIERKFHFAHKKHANCPYDNGHNLTDKQILAMQYNGAKESLAHKNMKWLLIDALSNDASFGNIESEVVVKGFDGEWRKPDVKALYGDKFIAFEIQLSTTFLSVIVERREFYLKNNALIFWIFNEFDPKNTKMTQEDIFYNNNGNIFIIDNETVEKSREEQSFYVRCVWMKNKGEPQKVEWGSSIVAFADLTLDFDKQRAFYFDLENSDISTQKEKARNEFLEWYEKETRGKSGCEISENFGVEFGEWIAKFREYSIDIPQKVDDRIIGILLSAKKGYPIGFDFKKIIEIAHLIFNAKNSILKPYLGIFGRAINHYHGKEYLINQDESGKWRQKLNDVRESLKNNKDFSHNKQYDELIAFLFPELINILIKINTINMDKK